jgi:hypothetical protein
MIIGTPRRIQAVKRIKGKATIRMLKKGIRVVFDDGDVYDLSPTDVPENIVGGKAYVELNRDGTKMYTFRPYQGNYFVRFAGFASREGEPPVPRLRRGGKQTNRRTGETYYAADSLTATALFEIVDGRFKGVLLPKYLYLTNSYGDELFQEYENSGVAVLVLSPAPNSRSARLEQFLTLCGLDWDKDQIPYSDNVLPAIEEILLSKNVILSASVTETGWVDTLSELPEGVKLPKV